MAINLTTKYSDKVAERFSKQSVTASAASSDYTFEGIKTLKVYSVDTVPLANYNRSGGMTRFGNVSDLGDTVQEMSMTQDKAFTFSIDKGNAKEQMNIKAATKSLKRELDEIVIPTLDKYRLDKWAHLAGSQEVPTAAPNKNTITGYVMNCTETLDNALVPDAGRTMFITTAMYKELKQNPDFLGVDALAKETLVKGQVGEIDGMKVVKVPSTYLPTGVYWLITYKSACLAPAKLQDYKIHKDPPGINGDLVEGRIMHDAFVLGAKAAGVLACINGSYDTNAPTVTNVTANSQFEVAGDAGTYTYYTTDGSDPRYSDSATAVAANVANITYAALNNATADTSGTVKLRVASKPTNSALFQSPVANTITY